MPAGRELSTRTDGRRPKAPQEGTRGGWWAVCRLWGFDGAAACAGDGLAEVGGGGWAIGVGSLSPPVPSSEWFRYDQRHSTDRRRCRGDSDATPEARFPGGRV